MANVRFRPIVIALSLVLLSTATAAAAALPTKTYRVARYGVSIALPKSWTAQPLAGSALLFVVDTRSALGTTSFTLYANSEPGLTIAEYKQVVGAQAERTTYCSSPRVSTTTEKFSAGTAIVLSVQCVRKTDGATLPTTLYYYYFLHRGEAYALSFQFLTAVRAGALPLVEAAGKSFRVT